jgi:hypothetical protein
MREVTLRLAVLYLEPLDGYNGLVSNESSQQRAFKNLA